MSTQFRLKLTLGKEKKSGQKKEFYKIQMKQECFH